MIRLKIAFEIKKIQRKDITQEKKLHNIFFSVKNISFELMKYWKNFVHARSENKTKVSIQRKYGNIFFKDFHLLNIFITKKYEYINYNMLRNVQISVLYV